ncbi:MAG: hypothetical protein LBB28_00655 [Synergistaceae bacterium]|jgi:hypothetical protein|nr:hypothetical protein [Synergistaceae bacterium]
MKKFVFSLLMISALLWTFPIASGHAGEEYMADTALEPADFRGIKWQQRLDSLTGMEELYRDDESHQIACYRKGEDMTFGGARLSSIEYIFVDGKLSNVSVVVKGENEAKSLLEEASALYGKETVKNADDYYWRFTDVAVMFSKEPGDQSVLFYQYIGFMRNRR